MNYFHINRENREKAMPLILKPLGLEVLLVFFFLFFFFPLICFVLFSQLFCFGFLKQVFKVEPSSGTNSDCWGTYSAI